MSGCDWYQEWRKETKELHAGDVVNIIVGVKHWHVTAKDSWFFHLTVEVSGENISNEQLESISDNNYDKLK